MEQHLTSLEQDARQPRLAVETDGPAKTKTRERAEGTATAVQAVHEDCCSTTRVDPGPKTNSTRFGAKAELPALSVRDDVVVENRAAALKSCLPSFEMRSPTAADDLFPTGEASIATRTTNNQPPLRLFWTEETDSKTNLRTRVPNVLYDSSFLPAAHSCRRVIET